MTLSNAEKQKRYRARKAREKAALDQAGAQQTEAVAPVGGTVEPASVAGEGLTVTLKTDIPPKPKPSLRERLGLGVAAKQAQPAPARRRVSTRKSDTPNLVVTLLPTLLASLIAAAAKDRLPEEYQACAPANKEVGDVIGPIMAIIGRRIEIAAEVSQDAIDIANALICAMAYSVRAYITYVEIKKAREKEVPHDRPAGQPISDYERGLRAYQATANGTYGDPYRVNAERSASPVNGTGSNGASSHPDDSELRNWEAAQAASLFARDKQGRVQLGLLPGSVRRDDSTLD